METLTLTLQGRYQVYRDVTRSIGTLQGLQTLILTLRDVILTLRDVILTLRDVILTLRDVIRSTRDVRDVMVYRPQP